MKLINTFILLIISVLSANSQSYKKAFRDDMCQCIELVSQKRSLTNNVLKTCYVEILPNYADLIDATITEEDINKKFIEGQLARKDLLTAMYSELIYTCDTYYNFIDFQRTNSALVLRENASESELKRYNQWVALKPNFTTYYMRACVHFTLKNLKEAEADINKSLALNPNKKSAKITRKELELLAWVYEEQERFKEAVAIYDSIYLGDFDTNVAQLRALANRKSGGTMSQILKEEITSNKVLGQKENTNTQKNQKVLTSNKSKSETTIKSKKKDTAALRKLFKI
ncbi:tetratricopeptide repeat protein [Winogradskyella endarachnes]|uniref:Tetratricopeptide repeat protein n=1 Tax=Winogradskyella endarachnes TaxID=2681965 RepID=A0A6L6U800_9FLAO|nr:tetratricopeptide repeat protein [Winogradskyella endarachnes]MUU78298.1 tetratricopeptide repeat protein [Winogradskyella endarachnes]